jgi:hypothetical protein
VRLKELLLFAFAVMLIGLWVMGLVNSYTLGGVIHLLLVVAIALSMVRVFGGRRRS